MASDGKISRKVFWELVEQRLAACSAGELRAILRAMAQETLSSGRRAFLSRLDVGAAAVVTAAQVIRPEDLPDAIKDLAEEIDGAMQDAEPGNDEYGWDASYDDEDSLGPYGDFVESLSELFDRADAAFDYGEFALARTAYRMLFDVLEKEDDYGRGVHVHDLSGVDTNEVVARYLRAIYEVEPPARRVETLYLHMQRFSDWSFRFRPMLDDLVQISPRPLPERESFLEEWIAFLRKQEGPSGSLVDAWLREAVRLAQGTSGLEALARAEGQTRPRAYLDWFSVLEEEGRYREVLIAAREALQDLPAQLPIRAAVADHLCVAAAQLGEVEALRLGRWEAFSAKPVLVRLLDLWEMTEDEADRTTLVQRAVEYIRDYLEHFSASNLKMEWATPDAIESPASIGRSVLTHAYLLAGDWDAAHHLAAEGKILGWSGNDSYQGMTAAAFLVVLSGKPPEALPPNLAQFWQSSLAYSTGLWAPVNINQEDAVPGRLGRAYTRCFATAVLPPKQQEKLLSWCLEIARERVAAIVGNLHRGSYDKAAVLTVACAETLRLRGDRSAAGALLDDVRAQFPRHSAFQREMKNAMQVSARG